jgi:hypothetical protein
VNDEGTSRLRHYHDQGRRHLNRVLLSYRLALDTVQHAPVTWEGKYAELIRGSFPTARRDEYLMKVSNGLHEVHLVSLKSNFELFLNRMLSTVWVFHFAELAGTISNARLRKLAVNAHPHGKSEDAFLNLIDKIVPRHGLDQFEEALKDSTQVSLPDALNAKDLRYWPQILTAFGVRHLVEHRDGKVDHRFQEKVSAFWSSSSWGRRLRFDGLRKVDVQEEDVVETWSAMCEASGLITAELVRWNSGQA